MGYPEQRYSNSEDIVKKSRAISREGVPEPFTEVTSSMKLQNRTGLLSKPYIAPSTSGGELPAPVDIELLTESYGEEQVELLLAAFVEHSDRMFAQLEKDTHSHNKESILNLLHQLKAMAAGVFANELAKSVRELEQKCKPEDVVWSDIEYELSECLSFYERMRSYVSAVLEIQLS